MVRLANLSHVKQVLYQGGPWRTEFLYSGVPFNVPLSTRKDPFVEVEIGLAVRLLQHFGDVANGVDFGLYEFTDETGIGILENLDRYAAETGSDDPPARPESPTGRTHPILGNVRAFSAEVSGALAGTGGAAGNIFDQPLVKWGGVRNKPPEGFAPAPFPTAKAG